MICSYNTDLSANHAVFAYFGGTCNAHLGCNNRVFANNNIVGNLYEIIQFYTFTNTHRPIVALSIVVFAPIST